MKHFFLLSILCITIAWGGFRTPNTGVVWNLDSLVMFSDSTVTGTFPHYNIIDTVTIAENDVVEITAGSILLISGQGIVVYGTMRAIGTANARIVFSSRTPAPASWKELRFEDSSTDGDCMLFYCVVEYADKSINCINASPRISHSTIRYNNNYGIQCFGSNATIDYDSIYNNVKYGINVTFASNPYIEHCVIFDNNTQNTGPKNQISIGTQGINSPVVRFNEIYGSVNFKTGGISISALLAGSGSNAIIEGNYIHNNSFGIVCAGADINVIIKNNRIENNTLNPNPLQGGSGINVNYSASNTPIITGNNISGNLWGITIQGNAQPNIGNLSNEDSTDDGKNVFINNTHNDTIFNLYNNTSGNILAQNNYWGSSNSDSVAMTIFDHADFPNLGEVLYEPYLLIEPTVSINDNTDISENEFILEQNFPNPFNPKTTISFSLFNSSNVTVNIYDVLGRNVATLLHNIRMHAGKHFLEFDATQLSGGIYFYSLRTNKFSSMKKMIFLQ